MKNQTEKPRKEHPFDLSREPVCLLIFFESDHVMMMMICHAHPVVCVGAFCKWRQRNNMVAIGFRPGFFLLSRSLNYSPRSFSNSRFLFLVFGLQAQHRVLTHLHHGRLGLGTSPSRFCLLSLWVPCSASCPVFFLWFFSSITLIRHLCLGL